MKHLLIKNGHLIDPANQINGKFDLLIEKGKIVKIAETIEAAEAKLINAQGLLVIPGVVDMAARLREPGLEYKADITSETTAAARAGITTLCCPPDTDPVIDEPAVVELIHRRTEDTGLSKVVTLGALTHRLRGEHLSEMAALKEAGCVGMSNAKQTVTNSLVFSRALEYAATFDLTVYIEPNDPWIGADGCAHDGAIATRLGLPGIPEAAETTIIARDLELIADTGVRAHFGRLSCSRSVNLIHIAQKQGLPVTADVAAHQLFLTDMDLSSYNSNCHVIPPFRELRDRDSLRTALAQGIISVICSDHQPHEPDAKLRPYPDSEPGISGLETLLPLTLKLVDEKLIDLNTAIAKLTSEPARILGIDAGHLGIGADADITIIDTDNHWQLNDDAIHSKGLNTPFHGWDFNHRVMYTVIEGKVIYKAS